MFQEDPSGARISATWIESTILRDNLVGLEPRRPLAVYLPAAARDPSRRFPVLYALASWTGAGRTMLDWEPFRESLFARLNRLIDSGAMPPCVVVCPDLYTSYGGSQYINSAAMGRHGDFIVRELIPHVEAQFPVLPGPEHRGVFGRSSGGFGALRLALDYPGSFTAVACHSGDLGFDLVYGRDLIQLVAGLQPVDGDVGAWLAGLKEAPKLSGHDTHLLMLLGMAATYSPDTGANPPLRLPIDLHTGERIEEIWQLWLDHDPLRLVQARPAALQGVRRLYVECGTRDQYYLLYGARQLHASLKKLNISHRYEEFPDNHSGTAYRYDLSLPWLLE